MAIVKDKDEAEEEEREQREKKKKQTLDLSHLPDAIPDDQLGDPQ
jgi:hypothetical protein